MRERPAYFPSPIVRSIIAGTTTRLIQAVKVIDPKNLGETMTKAHWQRVNREKPMSFGAAYFCPYGQTDDRLWVRETWSSDFANHYPHDRFWYAADDDRRHDIEVRGGISAALPHRWVVRSKTHCQPTRPIGRTPTARAPGRPTRGFGLLGSVC